MLSAVCGVDYNNHFDCTSDMSVITHVHVDAKVINTFQPMWGCKHILCVNHYLARIMNWQKAGGVNCMAFLYSSDVGKMY